MQTRHPVALPPGYTSRPPLLADLAAAHELMAAVDLAEAGQTDADTDDLRLDWEAADLDADAMLIHAADGALVGYALVSQRGHVKISADVYVHPGHLGRGLGTALTRFTEGRAAIQLALAPRGARIVLGTYINGDSRHAPALLAAEGYAEIRHFWRMLITLDAPPPAPAWPAGLAVRPFHVGQDDERAYATIADAFGDMWGYTPPGFVPWRAFMIERRDFDPALWALVEDGAQVAAALCAYQFPDRGWIRSLGVRRPWRRQGLALALLHHAFGQFWARGQRTIGLGVDAQSPTGATRLYERAGMHVSRRFTLWEKELRPGGEIAAPEADD